MGRKSKYSIEQKVDLLASKGSDRLTILSTRTETHNSRIELIKSLFHG